MKQFKHTLGTMVLLILALSLLSQEKKPSEEWSKYLGFMQWKDAKKKCISIGMKLPTKEELYFAYTKGITESWKENGTYYWSSFKKREGYLLKAYCISLFDGSMIEGKENYIHQYYGHVRCIR